MSRRKKLMVGVVTLLVMLAGGIAFAQWTSNATGPGRARATTAVNATINPSDGTADLFPGFTDGDLHFTIANTNPYPITYTDMTAGAVTSSDPDGCPASNVTVDSSATGLSLVAPANSTSGPLSIANVVSMSANAPDTCQGDSFEVALTLTGSGT
jgi:hypothetical protein